MALSCSRNAARFFPLPICATVLSETNVLTHTVYSTVGSMYKTWNFSLIPKSPNSAPQWQTGLRRTVRKQEQELSWDMNFCSSLAYNSIHILAPMQQLQYTLPWELNNFRRKFGLFRIQTWMLLTSNSTNSSSIWYCLIWSPAKWIIGKYLWQAGRCWVNTYHPEGQTQNK